MADPLSEMFSIQNYAQVNVYGDGVPLEDYPDERKIAFFKEQYIAISAEMIEVLDEMGWKPWASSRHFNEEAVQGELVDVWHFFMNLCIAARLTPELLHEKYLIKQEKNMKRQREGYDGVSTKCPKCRRALDDTATRCRPDISYCDEVGTY